MLDGVRPSRSFPAGESSSSQFVTGLGCAARGSLHGTGTAWGPPDGDGEEGQRLDNPWLWLLVPLGNWKGDVSALGLAQERLAWPQPPACTPQGMTWASVSPNWAHPGFETPLLAVSPGNTF